MTAITYHGDDDGVLAQVAHDTPLSLTYIGNTHRAIELAYSVAGVVQDYFGSDLNMIERLAGAGGEVPLTLINTGAGFVAGRTKTFDADADGGAYALTPMHGKKAVVFRLDAYTPDEGDEFLAFISSEDQEKRVVFSVNGVGVVAGTVIGGVSSEPANLGWTHATGDTNALWRDNDSGAWGVVLPDGTNTGNLGAIHGAPTSLGGMYFVMMASNTPGAGSMTVLNSGGPALPIGYTQQQFTG